jgi:hypothetical protein
MAKRSLSKKDRLPADPDAIDRPACAKAAPKLDAFAHKPLNDMIDRFRTRLIDEASRATSITRVIGPGCEMNSRFVLAGLLDQPPENVALAMALP